MYVFLILFPGGHQNHRQDPTEPVQPGKDLQRSADYEAAQPPPHHQTLPGTLLCVALCRMLFDPRFLLWRSPPGQHAGNRSGVFKPLSKKRKNVMVCRIGEITHSSPNHDIAVQNICTPCIVNICTSRILGAFLFVCLFVFSRFCSSALCWVIRIIDAAERRWCSPPCVHLSAPVRMLAQEIESNRLCQSVLGWEQCMPQMFCSHAVQKREVEGG